MGVVFAKQSASVSFSGGKVFVKKDQPWDAESALVKERPDLFWGEPTNLAGRSRSRGRPVERATRAPGEVRDVAYGVPVTHDVETVDPGPVLEADSDPAPARKPGRPKLPRDADGNIVRD